MSLIHSSSGFTIIESLLFLAISSLLFIIISRGQGVLLDNSRFTDSIDSVQTLLERTKNEANFSVNGSTCPTLGAVSGASDFVFFGQAVRFGYTPAEESKVFITPLVIPRPTTYPQTLLPGQIIACTPRVVDISWGSTYNEAAYPSGDTVAIVFNRDPNDGNLHSRIIQDGNILNASEYNSSAPPEEGKFELRSARGNIKGTITVNAGGVANIISKGIVE